MSYNAELQSNNEDLQEILRQVNELPDGPGDVVRYTKQSLSEDQKAQARENIGAGTSDFSGDYADLTNVPSEFPPAAHDASKVTSGTFAGAVFANANGQSPGASLVRNSKLVATETTPTVNGEIFWVYG